MSYTPAIQVLLAAGWPVRVGGQLVGHAIGRFARRRRKVGGGGAEGEQMDVLGLTAERERVTLGTVTREGGSLEFVVLGRRPKVAVFFRSVGQIGPG